MSAKKGSAVPIWFSEEERFRLEEGAALAGYKHLSTYIKDKVFARGDFRNDFSGHDSTNSFADEISTRLDLLMADQATQKAALAVIVFAMTQELSSSFRLELIRKFKGLTSEKAFFESIGDLGRVIEDFSKEMQ